MVHLTVASLLGLASLVSALPDNWYPPSDWYPTVHEITVGGLKPDGTPNLNFSPNNIKANPGDKIKFTL